MTEDASGECPREHAEGPASAVAFAPPKRIAGEGPAEGEAVSLVGRRVRVAGNLATVHWGPGQLQAPPSKKPAPAATGGAEADAAAAPTQPSVVEVVGIEYDEPGLGKHDGSYQGQRLFTCKPGFGSFVKVEKIELGVSIQKAWSEKYFAGLLPDAATKSARAEQVDALDYTDSKGQQKEFAVEMVGRYCIEQRQQRLEAFVEAALAETNLERRYPEDVWQNDWCLPNLKSLWLDKTLLQDWSDIMAICELCPQLEWLSLAKTRLKPLRLGGGPLPPAEGAPVEQGCGARLVLQPFTCKVRSLVLNQTFMSWETLLAIHELNLFPQLEQLHLSNNGLAEGIPEFKVAASGEMRRPFPRLKRLVLDANGITDWRVIPRAIAAFPCLEALHLNENLLGDTLDGLVEMAADTSPRRLTALILNENRLSTWGAIGALSGYALLELKAQRNPVTEGDSTLASPMLLRQIFIALMPTLLRLNACEVTVKERAAAERYFITIARDEGNRVVQGLNETCNVAAHLERLRGLHGDIVGSTESEEKNSSRTALLHALAEVTLRPVACAILDQAPATKKVPHTMTVAELKRLAQLMFKQVPLERVQLVLADPALPFGVPLDDESRELGFYGLDTGAEIHVADSADAAQASKNVGGS
mmetsp:Transcript_74970/g.160526  ORF Transcript_74970/g.160526 Transcript_74970/m.160526 type:complete len:645 (+) Transcript_74970:52-1986(+)